MNPPRMARTGRFFSLLSATILLIVPKVAAAPANDLFANRIELQGSNVEFTINFRGATFEENDPLTFDPQTRGSAWWSWTAPGDGDAHVTSIDNFGTVRIAAFRTSDPQALPTSQAQVGRIGPVGGQVFLFRVRAGQTYIIGLSGPSGSDTAYQLSLGWTSAPPPPANDDFYQRATLQPSGQEFSGTTFRGSLEPEEPVIWRGFNDPGERNSSSVWWTWTPTVSGFAAISLIDRPQWTEEHPRLLVLRASSLRDFINSPAEIPGGYVRVLPGYFNGFEVRAGETYAIGLFGPSVDEATYRFHLAVSESAIFLRQPQSATARPGASAVFTAQPAGVSGVSWHNTRWQFNGQDLPAETIDLPTNRGLFLVVNNVSAANAGVYRAVITVGGVDYFSEPASLTLDGVDVQPRVRLDYRSRDEISVVVEDQESLDFWIQGSFDLRQWYGIELFGPHFRTVPGLAVARLRTDIFPANGETLFLRADRRGVLRERCVANLRLIRAAKEHWAFLSLKPPGYAPDDAAINSFLPGAATPSCPRFGQYTYHAVGANPTCDVPGHVLPD